MKRLIIIPAYNESQNILAAIEDLRENGPKADYIVVNDCSTDDTVARLRENAVPYLNIPVNLGIGGCVQTGYRYAYENGYDIAVQFDGDGQHLARYLPDLIAPLEQGKADVVIGSRFLTNDGFQTSFMRRTGIRFLSSLILRLCGTHVRDVTSGMRAINRRVLKEFSGNYAQDYPEPEAVLDSKLLGAAILEVPVQMRARQNGTSSINCFRAVYYMAKVSLSLILTRIFSKGEK